VAGAGADAEITEWQGLNCCGVAPENAVPLDGPRLRPRHPHGRHFGCQSLPRMARIGRMSEVTRILSQLEAGHSAAASELLPLVYEELRNLAAAKLAQEKPGQTLQATALVHEAY